ncbi:MAG: hypothetical protein ACHP7D_03045 [Lysobacterales bacterium]
MSVGAWQPRWIGAASRPLYAAAHPAPDARVGVVMAPPLLHEQPRSRRVLVEIASRFAEAGLPCLRFDWFGTGDSAGAGEQHDFAAMHADLDAAVQALRAETGVARAAVLAFRGAALPASTWVGTGREIAALALWEPVVDGAAWLAQLEAADRSERLERYGVVADDLHDTNLMGFPTSPRWRSDVATARLGGAAPGRAPVWIVARTDALHSEMMVAAPQRSFELPPDAPRFDDGVGIENAMFLSRKLFGVIDELGRALARC